MRVLKLVYMKGLISEKVHACGVYSTFGLRALGFLGKVACMIRKGLGHLLNIWAPQR